MSLDILREHREIWSARPSLRAIYAEWFDVLLGRLPSGASVLELGAGPGFLAEYARARRPDLRWLSSDLLPAPWNDLVADALKLPVENARLDAVVGVDFVHHLARPGDFFTEAARVLKPTGQVVTIEPWITPFSFPIYRLFHQEQCRLGGDPFRPWAEGAAKEAFDGDAALSWALVRSGADWGRFGLRPPEVETINTFAYLLSLGFRRGSLFPDRLLRRLLTLDRATARLSRWLAVRACIVWRKA
jgi:SAM-dependent methyltransferase